MTHIDNHTTRLWLLLIAVFTIGVLHATSTAADEATFLADLEALTTGPHRLSGTAEGRAAADHIVQRLEAIGVDRVLTLSLPVWQTEVLRCEVEIDGKTVDLLPLRPNVITPTRSPRPEASPGRWFISAKACSKTSRRAWTKSMASMIYAVRSP